MTDLDTALLEEVQEVLGRLHEKYAGRPDLELEQLWLLALEREQIVAVAYREEAVAARVEALQMGSGVRALIRQTLVWIWKDEQLHEEYLRGLLLQRGGLNSSVTVYGRALEGAVSGWASSTENNLHIRNAPLRTGAAALLVNAASLMGKVPAALKPELRYQTFRRYCALNAGLEASAELAYRRLLEITSNAEQRETFGRIREDEGRHAAAFRILAAAVTDDDRLAAGASLDGLLTSLGAVSPWFVPASLRRPVRAPAAVPARSVRTPGWPCAAVRPTPTRRACSLSAWKLPAWRRSCPAPASSPSGPRSCSATTGTTGRT